MSRIDDLIEKHCPNGVPRRRLAEIGELVRGRRFTKDDVVPGGLPAIHYGEIYTHYGTSADVALSHVRPELRSQLRFARQGDVVIAAVGETVEDVGKAVAWLGADEVAIHDDCYYLRHEMDPKFVAYCLQTAALNQEKASYVSRAKVKRLSSDGLSRLVLPVPPIEVQREIVKVLDLFTALGAELEAELEARRGQYAHYRQVILDQVQADHVPLSALGRWQGGVTPSRANPAYWEAGTIPWLASMDVSDTSTDEIRGRVTERALAETGLRLVPAPSVAVVMRSNILRRTLPIGLVKVDTTVNQDMRVLVPSPDVDAEYLFQALQADAERLRVACVRTDGSMAAVDSGTFFGWELPVPSLAEQRRVAAKLRNFDALVNDLSVGLPAELKARRQQYEYYRDRLLTFEELAA